MASLNKVMLIGNLTRDPEVRYTPKGTAVTEIGLAVNRRYTAESGEKREEVTFVDITFWGRTAEVVGQYLRKGSSIYVEGRLQLDSWDDKQTGQKRSKLRVTGESLEFLGGREGGSREGSGGGRSFGGGSDYEPEGRSSGRQAPNRPPATLPKPPADPDLDVEDDDIPF